MNYFQPNKIAMMFLFPFLQPCSLIVNYIPLSFHGAQSRLIAFLLLILLDSSGILEGLGKQEEGSIISPFTFPQFNFNSYLFYSQLLSFRNSTLTV